MRILLGALALITVACASPSIVVAEGGSDVVPEWTPVDADTGAIDDVAGLEALASSFPASGLVRLRLLRAQLAVEDFEGFLGSLRWLHDRGYVFSDTSREQIPQLVGKEHAAEASALLLPPAEPIEASEIVAEVPAEAGLVESVLMDPDGGNITVSSVSGRSLWSKDLDSDWREVRFERAGNLSGIVFDPEQRMIWSASGRIDGSSDDDAMFAGLVGIRLPGDEPHFVAAPEGTNLSDLHRAEDGSIYASDPLGGGIYVLRPGSDAFDTLVPPGIFRSPQGLATSEAGQLLYVSDYNYGLAAIDLVDGRISRLAADGPIILDGIDGLWRDGDRLVGVRNGGSPMAIVALTLSPDGLHVVDRHILEQAHSEWTEPLSGYFGGGALYYVGNGQWDRWVAGQPAEGKPSVPTQIRKLELTR